MSVIYKKIEDLDIFVTFIESSEYTLFNGKLFSTKRVIILETRHGSQSVFHKVILLSFLTLCGKMKQVQLPVMSTKRSKGERPLQTFGSGDHWGESVLRRSTSMFITKRHWKCRGVAKRSLVGDRVQGQRFFGGTRGEAPRGYGYLKIVTLRLKPLTISRYTSKG